MVFVCSIMASIHLKDPNIPLKQQSLKLFHENCVNVCGFCHNIMSNLLNYIENI